MVAKKHKSKRQAASQRYKIQQKVKDHHKKVTKLAKKNPLHNSHKSRKDPGIPNSLPFKESVLEEVERTKQAKVSEKEQRQKMAQMLKKAEDRANQFDAQQQRVLEEHVESQQMNQKTFYREYKKVVEQSDVILQVLDARDPQGSRAVQVERYITETYPDKRIVLILNKIDLVPDQSVVDKWVLHLRKEFPTLAFKASTQKQRENLSHSSQRNKSQSFGAPELQNLLKNYSRTKVASSSIKTNIVVGVIGLPNTGKSSLVNSLKRSKVCSVGDEAGVTKVSQLIKLDAHCSILDSPGVIFTKEDSSNSISVLRNITHSKIQKVDDPVSAVEHILKVIPQSTLIKVYSRSNAAVGHQQSSAVESNLKVVRPFVGAQDFLVQLSKIRGRVRHGGLPDIEGAAKLVLKDWAAGKIPYYTLPPSAQESNKPDSLKDVEIVSEWSKEFSIEEFQPILEVDALAPSFSKNELRGCSSQSVEIDMDAVPYYSEEEMLEEEILDDESEVMSDEESSYYQVAQEESSDEEAPQLVDVIGKRQAMFTEEELQLNPQHHKNQQKLMKKAKKNQRRAARAQADDDDVVMN